jgi:hypothetical protein
MVWESRIRLLASKKNLANGKTVAREVLQFFYERFSYTLT